MPKYSFGGVNLKTLGFHNGVANAAAYGAIGDNSTDNTGIVQAIIDGFELLQGGTILLPTSREDAIGSDPQTNYRFTANVVNDAAVSVSFIGGSAKKAAGGNLGGRTVNWFLDSDTNGECFIEYAGPSGAAVNFGPSVKNISFVGKTSGIGTNQSGILWSGKATSWTIENCGFNHVSGYAIAHDPTVDHTYHQGSTIRGVDFRQVGGCFGPISDYQSLAPSASYIFCSGLNIENVNLDEAVKSLSPQPFLWDFRATRNITSSGTFVNEGAGAAGQTAIIAFMCDGYYIFSDVYVEIVNNRPTYFLAYYGDPGGRIELASESYTRIHHVSQPYSSMPIFIENESTNEPIVSIGRWQTSFNSVGDIVTWEDGVGANYSGRVDIDDFVGGNLTVPQQYWGRLRIKASRTDQQARLQYSQKAVKLMSWNADDGSLLRHWGGAYVELGTAAFTASHAIEADGNFLVHRFTGGSTANFPHIIFRALGDIVDGAMDGAVITIAYKHRITIDAADSGITPALTPITGFAQTITRINTTTKNTADYQIAIANGIIDSAGADPNRAWRLEQSGGNATVAAIVRIAAVEIWLGTPEHLDLSPAKARSESATGTFTCSVSIPTTSLNSSGGAVTATLPDGINDGQRKKITMSDATTSSTVSVTSHETSDPEVFTFNATADVLILEWDSANAYWWTVKNIGVAT